jgi:hypothetical protein
MTLSIGRCTSRHASGPGRHILPTLSPAAGGWYRTGRGVGGALIQAPAADGELLLPIADDEAICDEFEAEAQARVEIEATM